MLGPIEGSIEFSLFGIFEWYSEIVKELPWLVLKDSIEEVYKMWTSATSLKSVSNGIRVDIFNWYFKEYLILPKLDYITI